MTDKREQEEEKGRGERGKHSVLRKRGVKASAFTKNKFGFCFLGISTDVEMTLGEFLVHAV